MVCSVTKLCLTLLWPNELQPASLLCPWDFTGKNTGLGCHFFLQRIFPTQGSNCSSCIGRWILYHWATWEAQSKLTTILTKSLSLYFNLENTSLRWEKKQKVAGANKILSCKVIILNTEFVPASRTVSKHDHPLMNFGWMNKWKNTNFKVKHDCLEQ